MKINLPLLSCIVLVSACQNEEQAKVETLEKEVMMIHDAVMPKMGELVALEGSISKKITHLDSLLQITPNDTTLRQSLKQSLQLASQLRKADEDMMNWMHEYKGDSLKKLPTPQAIQGFTQEKIIVEQVSDDMLKSIEQTQNFLKQYPKNQ
ncbi:MAG: viral A-type inclusion protein [Spirosomataceae bacterium]